MMILQQQSLTSFIDELEKAFGQRKENDPSTDYISYTDHHTLPPQLPPSY